MTTSNAAALFGGFLITGQYAQNAGATGSPAYILDADGEVVWNFSIGRDVTGVRMSFDGKYMWINSANVPENQGANVHRVSMDGLTDENLTSQFTGQNHQLTVLPDETIAFYAYSSNGCDDIKERSPSGTVKTIINAQTAQRASGACHVNNIQYFKEDDSLVFSDLDHNAITKVKRNGTVVWVLGGSTSNFTGDGASWQKQHGIHLLALDRLLFFNNGSGGLGGASLAVEMKLDLTAKTSTKVWSYASSPGISNAVMGDVQRLSNGNSIVGYSTQGVLHEVDAQSKLLQELAWPAGASFGYIEKRKTLYGPPPR